MFPDGINGSDSHLVGVGVGDGEDQQVAAVHALGFQRELGFNDRRVKVGTREVCFSYLVLPYWPILNLTLLSCQTAIL